MSSLYYYSCHHYIHYFHSFIFLQLTLKVILNPRVEEEDFYMKIRHSPYNVLGGRDENNEVEMNVDIVDVQEAQIAEAIAEAWVFDSPPHEAKVRELFSQEPYISQSKWDKLVVDIAEVKANQLEIFKMLDMVLDMDQKIKTILEILSKKEEQKQDNDSEFTRSPLQIISYTLPHINSQYDKLHLDPMIQQNQWLLSPCLG